LVFQTDPAKVRFYMGIVNDTLTDAYGFLSYNNLPLQNGTKLDWISLRLEDGSAQAFSSDALPVMAIDVEYWNSHKTLGSIGFLITGQLVGGSPLQVFGRGADLVSAEVVPEPATVLLLSLGGLALVRGKRRKN
jgi:hypothetical protein